MTATTRFGVPAPGANALQQGKTFADAWERGGDDVHGRHQVPATTKDFGEGDILLSGIQTSTTDFSSEQLTLEKPGTADDERHPSRYSVLGRDADQWSVVHRSQLRRGYH